MSKILENWDLLKNNIFIRSRGCVVKKEELTEDELAELMDSDSSLFSKRKTPIQTEIDKTLQGTKSKIQKDWEVLFGSKPSSSKKITTLREEISVAYQYKDITGNKPLKDIVQMRKEIKAHIES